MLVGTFCAAGLGCPLFDVASDAGYAVTVEADAVWFGAHGGDHAIYPDCRPEFIEAFQSLAALATKQGVEGRPVTIEAPLVALTKAEIIRQGVAAGVDGVFLEIHDDPTHAKSDGQNALPLDRLEALLTRLLRIEAAAHE